MIGNDIVDLKLAKTQSNWQRPRFLSKLFSKEEQETIFSSEDKFAMVWRLWSMKEAAYKAHQREFNLVPKFNPKDFECTLISSEAGCVNIDYSEYKTFTKAPSGFMYTKAFTKGLGIKLISEIKEDDSILSLKRALITSFSWYFQFPKSNLELKKCKHGIPRIYLNNQEFPISFSITHHGKYSAYLMLVA